MGSDDVRRAAGRIQHLGDDVRRLADRTVAAGSVRWRSTAASAFRKRLGEEAIRLRHAASHLDDAAEDLRRHASAVEGKHGWFGLGDGR